MLTPLGLIVVVAALQGPAQAAHPVTATGSVRGQVVSETSGQPLRFAYVEIVDLRGAAISPTDSVGGYLLRNVPPGWHLLRAVHIDHAPHEIEVLITEGKEVALDFTLELRPVVLPPVTTRGIAMAPGSDTVSATSAALGPASVRALESTPGVAELGLAEIAREVPGPNPPDASDVLYVRGSAADLKLVLLDGAPVYAPFHLGGLINALDPEVLHGVTLYLGGAPARYDGGLSYVMDLETRAGRANQDHASLSLDLLGGRATMEGPIFKGASYLLGGRAVHGLGAERFVGGPFPYLYGDALARLDIDLGRHGRITTTGFWNRESVRLDSLSGYKSKAIWGNNAGSARYRSQIAGSNVDVTLGVGEFQTELPVGGQRPLMTDGVARRLRLGVNVDRAMGPVHLHYGVQYDRLSYDYSAWPRPRTVRDDSLVLRADGAGKQVGTYIDADLQAGPHLRLRAGARADVFSLDPTPRFAPRAAATLVLSDRASLTLAAGKYRQYVRPSGEALTLIGTALPDSVRKRPLNVASASHLVLSLDQDLGSGIQLGIEGFYKHFEGLPSPDGDEAQSSGVDLWVRRGSGRITGWVGYSLAWVWSVDEPLTRQQRFAGRHLVSAGLGGPLGNQGRVDVRVAYGAGLPYTAIPEPETPPVFAMGLTAAGSPMDDPVVPLPNEPDDPYLRLDLQVSRTFITD
ncbi:MAG TPA: carboxypeptidase regulatory-like domain-containing protein, partial [Longimicrobiales bacterium]|nr:carboxypeptidase regulatory-like domain-containing protein [Longimicrobiales bacterium]